MTKDVEAGQWAEYLPSHQTRAKAATGLVTEIIEGKPRMAVIDGKKYVLKCCCWVPSPGEIAAELEILKANGSGVAMKKFVGFSGPNIKVCKVATHRRSEPKDDY